ncbi:MAG TPA: hypothetical protein DEO33_03600 [Rikenellaceae bacterium]|nr:hypothetical protein [Rikenellaceae bacterium]
MSEYPKEIKERIQKLEAQINDVKNASEDVVVVKNLFPEMFVCVDKDVNCYFTAKSMNEVKSILKTFAKAGIMLDQFNANESSPVWYLKGNKTTIRLQPNWLSEEIEGATCRLVRTGEEVVTYPKYKLICEKEEEL